ncbi:MAG: hypothetical protein HY000_09700 [Planctomycetes bacterium]|nr:hypothetical protein [Planctomycetota bacterium]
MGGVISFRKSPEAIWLKTGWIFTRFLADLLVVSPDDEEFTDAIQKAEVFQRLGLYDTAEENPELANKLKRAIKEVALATLEDSADRPLKWKEGLDPAGQVMYLDSIRELLEIMDKTGNDFG